MMPRLRVSRLLAISSSLLAPSFFQKKVFSDPLNTTQAVKINIKDLQSGTCGVSYDYRLIHELYLNAQKSNHSKNKLKHETAKVRRAMEMDESDKVYTVPSHEVFSKENFIELLKSVEVPLIDMSNYKPKGKLTYFSIRDYVLGENPDEAIILHDNKLFYARRENMTMQELAVSAETEKLKQCTIERGFIHNATNNELKLIKKAIFPAKLHLKINGIGKVPFNMEICGDEIDPSEYDRIHETSTTPSVMTVAQCVEKIRREKLALDMLKNILEDRLKTAYRHPNVKFSTWHDQQVESEKISFIIEVIVTQQWKHYMTEKTPSEIADIMFSEDNKREAFLDAITDLYREQREPYRWHVDLEEDSSPSGPSLR